MSLTIKPNRSQSDYVLDNLSTTSRNGLTVAFSLKPLSQSYVNPVVKLRHSVTGATKDFYANTSGDLGDIVGGVGVTPQTWLGTNNSALYLANEANVTNSTPAVNYVAGTYSFPSVFTVALWVNFAKFESTGNTRTIVFLTNSSGTIPNNTIYIAAQTNNIRIAFYAGNPIDYTGTVTINTWYHVTLIYNSGTLSLYVNGEYKGQTTGTLGQSGFMLGNPDASTPRPFAGYISDFRVYSRALTSPEIQYISRASSYPTPGITNMAVYLPFQSSTSDLSGNNVTITATGTMTYVAGTPIVALATVDTWYDQSGNSRNATQTTVGNQPVFIKRQNGNVLCFDGNSAKYLNYGLTGTSSIWYNTNYTAIIKEQRSSNVINNYVHGTTTGNTNQYLIFGYRTNTQFTHAQWNNDYNYTVSGFEIKDTTNTYPSILTYTTGTPIISTDSPYAVPEGSFGFDGIIGKYISISANVLNSDFNWWTNGGCTIECWVKYPTFTNASRGSSIYIVPILVGVMNPTTANATWGFGATTTGNLRFYYWNGTGNGLTTTSTLSLNKWTHIAMSCDSSSNIRLFINGILSAGPTLVSGTPVSGDATTSFTLGQYTNVNLTAYISNLRVVKGAALYTANFTPLTSTVVTTASSGTTLLLLRVPLNVNRWLVSHHTTDVPGKRMYLNQTQVLTSSENTSITTPGQATIGRAAPNYNYTGDVYDFFGFNISLPVSDQAAIATIDNYLNYSTRIPRIRTTTAIAQKAISLPSGNVFGTIPQSVMNTCVGAYSARKIVQAYTGPIFRLRRDSDSREVDVWVDYEGNVDRIVDISLDDSSTTGGTITYDGAYRIHTFTTNGTFTATSARVCDLLVVGGGGAGGSGYSVGAGGGGGGGQVVFKKLLEVNAGTFSLVVGAGGTAVNNSQSTNGSMSSFNNIYALGGGYGGSGEFGVINGGNGASGGGGGSRSTASNGIGGYGINEKKKSGGNAIADDSLGNMRFGGGGGGASQNGTNAIVNIGANGGDGALYSINGTATYYGGGGGGGARGGTQGIGGKGGGGAGTISTSGTATSAQANTGGGGGGGTGSGTGGQGGSGIVIVRTLRHQGTQGRNALTQWLGASTATVTKWYDQSGSTNHVTSIRGNPRISLYPNDAYMYGSFNDGLRFPTAILPPIYTLVHTAQYTSDYKLSNWTITGFTGGSVWLYKSSSGGYNYYELGHGGATYSSDLTLATYLISVPTNVIAANLTMYVDAYVMRTGPTAANNGVLYVDFLNSAQTVVGSSVTFSYVNATLNSWINSTGNVAVPTTAAYIRVRFGINYNETIRLRTDTLITIKNNSGTTVKQWYMGETNKRIFDGVTSDWSSGFLNGYAGIASHSTSNINSSPANGAVITSLNGWTGAGVGGSAGPILDRSTVIPHISLNGTSSTVGDYFDYGSTTWNLATNGGFSFIGMVRFTNSARSYERIFDFSSGIGNNNILLTRDSTGTNIGFYLYNGATPQSLLANVIVNNTWQIFACRLQNEGTNLWRHSIWCNGVKTTGTQYTATITDRTVTNAYIGRSPWTGDSYADIDFRELLWYNQALTDSQISSLYDYMNNKFNVNLTPWVEPPITPYLRFQPYYAYQASTQPFLATYPVTNMVITSINGATGYAVGGSTGPLYNVNLGIPHISLNGTSTTVGDYFDYGTRTLNLATNGGFAFIGMVRFNAYGDYARIFEFGNTSSDFVSLQLGSAVSQTIVFQIKINNVFYWTSSVSINLNQWYIFATQIQYISSSSFVITFWINNIKYSSTWNATLSDFTYSTTYIGRTVTGNSYAAISLRDLYFYNSYLTDGQINLLYQYLNNKYNNQTVPWFLTPPITPTIQFNPLSLMQNLYTSNLVLSVDQNSPNLYRANGVAYNSTTFSTSNTQLSVNYGASGEYSDWIVKDVVVFNNTLSTANVTTVESALLRRRLGILDQIAPSAKATAVAAYSFRLLTVTYTGPCVRIRRATDSVEKDFYASITGDLGDLYMGRGQSLKEWLNGAVGYVRTWYDQTGRGKHVEQATTASQPTVVLSNTKGNGIYFNNQVMAGPNVFDTTTVSNMHIVIASREIVRTAHELINLNGTNVTGTGGRFSVHAPWSDNVWYFDPGNATTDRAYSTAGITSVNQKAILSGYKSSTDGKNGFRVNKGTRYLSTGTTAATVSGGIHLGFQSGYNIINHNIYATVIFSAKLSTTDELIIENNIAPFA